MYGVEVLIDDARFLSGNWGWVRTCKWRRKFVYYGKRLNDHYGAGNVLTTSILDMRVAVILPGGWISSQVFCQFDTVPETIETIDSIWQCVTKQSGSSTRGTRRTPRAQASQAQIKELMRLFPFPPHSA